MSKNKEAYYRGMCFIIQTLSNEMGKDFKVGLPDKTQNTQLKLNFR